MRSVSLAFLKITAGIVASFGIVVSLWFLRAGQEGVVITPTRMGETPATIFRPAGSQRVPVVVIAHGFAGSQQLMRPFALTFAKNGYIAVTFDFPGHGRNPTPLTGDIEHVDGATKVLVDEVARIASVSRPLGDGRLAVLGHSMASDIVVRFAAAMPDVAATIAVSMFSPAVTQDVPRNLLVIVGDLETFLKGEALRAVGLATPGGEARAGVTYGDPAQGSGRRAAFSSGVEHIGVLYSHDSMAEALAWLDATFSVHRSTPSPLDASGPMILLLLGSLVVLAWPLFSLMPQLRAAPAGAGLPWRKAWPGLLIPAILTPLILRVLPTHFLPVVVGDYLAAHFAVYGVITFVCLGWRHPRSGRGNSPMVFPAAFIAATSAYVFYTLGILGFAVNAFVTSFVAISPRVPLILALLIGTLAFFLGDEWFSRGRGAAPGLYVASKVAFLGSLALAVALDFERLFFLAIIIPVIIPLMLVYGLFSAWAFRRTGNPLVAGIGNSLAFAWAIGVTFPMLAS